MKFRTIYDEERPAPVLECKDESLCLAYQCTETSIEKLVKLANQNPSYLHAFAGDPTRQPEYGECPSPLDYQDALEIVARGEEAFYSLPANIRVNFSNPMEFLSWLEDPANYDEVEKLGLLDPEKVQIRKSKLQKDQKEEVSSEEK
ncbi:VP3 [Chlamydiamicrovirus Chp1]|uniref:Internal scaffolding protein VP3 n=1 Tax=Chlamydia phage 1 TaxID=2003327 RepID=B_BPCHP|nr:VP3 [Chlamydiamicrovirus Chp1]P19194.1 RecName: Full=Internal scaffolding protein VP3; AltName: Full=Protein VP3; Short=VP3 [Chlamydiamicrovirus Chp1]pir/JU0347/ capsid protein VP3 - Chlamydophila psittaci phage Chp1 [Chlamydiamicrovirus Chp1]BAA00509.1 VP3 [Chlamydiamicrovirus Chp1]